MPRKAASKPKKQHATRTLKHLTPRELLAEIVGDARMAPGVMDTHWPMDLAALPHRDAHEIADMLGLPLRAARRVAAALELHSRLIRREIPKRRKSGCPKT